ncbi:transglycosylase family protein [Candidatus Parcubacteria bacterium]|nr:transglycosylase family protein [Candidatus Parcubacteria bacterium]
MTLIAEQYELESWRPLWNVNKELTDPDVIHAGSSLIVPEGPTEDRPLPPEPAPVAAAPAYSAPVAVTRRSSTPANYAAGSGGLFARIRQLESGGNYATNTGNGYYGAYQFDLQTWRSVGGSGLPSNASPAEQDQRAALLYAQRGCSPWPNTCG